MLLPCAPSLVIPDLPGLAEEWAEVDTPNRELAVTAVVAGAQVALPLPPPVASVHLTNP